jgi:hypothetical protein
MRDVRWVLLLVEFALCFYNVGTIWAHEIDIFRSWKLVSAEEFHRLQAVHWQKIPYWIFIPVGLAELGSLVLLWYHPAGIPAWALWGNALCQLLALALTGAFWGRWQAKLSQDPLGSASPYLAQILRTHWVRTLLINASGLFVLLSLVQLPN